MARLSRDTGMSAPDGVDHTFGLKHSGGHQQLEKKCGMIDDIRGLVVPAAALGRGRGTAEAVYVRER